MRCPQYFAHEGCSLPDSYINSFHGNFWVEIYDEWQRIDRTRNKEQYYEKLNAFYQEHREMFVTDYAVTNPVEDIAETFSFFIFSPKPAGDTIAEKKIQFFYEYPELVELRDEIQDRICSLNP
ncbi:MAG: hypothetical protein HZB19_16675 [Chloroflexi bacterium]|nr:hypothetical protein [Chloroflexota bacterium]